MRSNKNNHLLLTLLTILVQFLFINNYAVSNNILDNLSFKQLSTFNGLPNDEVQKVFQDRDGFMWFATRYGLCKYDGYDVTLYKSNLYNPDLFTNNNIQCLAEDDDHNIWIGTVNGINLLNKETGLIKRGDYSNIYNVSCLLFSKKGVLWVGTDLGLYRYIPETDVMEMYDLKIGGNVAIKSLFEDSDGDIWIGTWRSGLHRIQVSGHKLYTYPVMNFQNSSHEIYEDSEKNIWVVGWGEGIYRLINPKDMSNIGWKSYRHDPKNQNSLLDDYVYTICEDINTGTLWFGTRSGLSIMSDKEQGVFLNYKPTSASNYIPCNETNSIIRDSAGNIWIGSIGGGVLLTNTKEDDFTSYKFETMGSNVTTSSVRTLIVDNDIIWMGIGTYGIACYERDKQEFQYYTGIREFSEIKDIPTITTIVKRQQSQEIWFGAYGGIYSYKEGEKVKHYTANNSDFFNNDAITSLFEDSRGNCWIGTRYGLGIKKADGVGFVFNNIFIDGNDLNHVYIRDIIEDVNGNIWLATFGEGLIRITGDFVSFSSLEYKVYGHDCDKFPVKHILSLQIDNHGRLLVGTEGYGLLLYDEKKDGFINMNKKYSLPGDMVVSIEVDNSNNLWLGTNAGLVRLAINDIAESNIRVYTAADGLQNNFFIPCASYNNEGELFFAGFNGINSFYPQNMEDKDVNIRFAITNIKIFNQSFHALDKKLQEHISLKSPQFSDEITLPYHSNNFTIEFASLTYIKPELNKYAYILEGFDKEWQYTDATRHFAYYNNLESGTYTFLLKATNENGVWSSDMRKIKIIIAPPLWATWWAYMIYLLILFAIICLVYRIVKNRIRLKNSLQLQKMEQAKVEELNHMKLQFFTNITHELLTPLTIISASVDELRMQAPQFKNLYSVMNINIQRLIRLLQQILEFRKAESSNLKLRVTYGEITDFAKNAFDAFSPLIKKRKLHFSFLSDPESISGYFDTDKLDKILYNLLSNAAKYNKEGGFVQVTLSLAKDKDFVLIKVQDNGVGISKENQKTLFSRFYEGDYRKFNTIGTGIGLSLTKDLVTLHRGEISVDSEQGKGTTFLVKLPIVRSYYKQKEIDEDVTPCIQPVSEINLEKIDKSENTDQKAKSVLVIEDNDELLQLMLTLLKREYKIFTATNGKEGIEVLEKEDIHLIVSDVMMPEMDGVEFTSYVKNKLEYSHIPIILLTAKNKDEDRAAAYESGADGYITKPFNLTVLHARIKNLLKSKERVARDFEVMPVIDIKGLNYTTIDEDFINRAIECVMRHLDDPDFDQPQFIKEMATSKSTLYKKLKSLTGLNTSAFIKNVRMKAAVRILEEKQGIRISELAYAVGFNDPKYFSNCFKEQFKMSPSEYIVKYIVKENKNS